MFQLSEHCGVQTPSEMIFIDEFMIFMISEKIVVFFGGRALIWKKNMVVWYAHSIHFNLVE